MVAVVAAARDGRRRSLVGPGLPPRCGPWTLLGGEQWGVDQWRGARALACAQPKGGTRSIHATDTPSRRQAAARKTGVIHVPEWKECKYRETEEPHARICQAPSLCNTCFANPRLGAGGRVFPEGHGHVRCATRRRSLPP